MRWFAAVTACLGSQASSADFSTTFSPLMPPAALMSFTACSTPCRNCSPATAEGPVRGATKPIVTSARAGDARRRPRARRLRNDARMLFHLGVFAVMPFVDGVFDIDHVALGIEADGAQNG